MKTSLNYFPETMAQESKKTQVKANRIQSKRQYISRNSLLTDLLEVEHFKTMHRIVLAILILSLCYNLFISTTTTTNSVRLCFRLIAQGLGQFHRAIFIWLLLCACAFIVHPVLHFWAKVRIDLEKNSIGKKLWDELWLFLWISLYVFILILPTYITYSNRLAMGSAFGVGMEQMRILMKIHAYLRTNVPKILRQKPHSDKQIVLPTFSNFLYFFFCPSLVYRDFYPRTPRIRLSFVICYFLEFMAAILCLSLILSNHLLPLFESPHIKCHTWSTLTSTIFSTILPSIQILIITFYSLLHCWLNAWAELLRFADRQFYSDWWNSTSYSTFFRRWNYVVHDFLHEYVYRDMYEIIAPGNKSVAMLSVFVLSGIFHEVVLTYTLNFLYPLLFVELVGGGGLMIYATKNKQVFGQTFFWITLLVGNSIMFSLYISEAIARINNSREHNFRNFVIPKTWTCK